MRRENALRSSKLLPTQIRSHLVICVNQIYDVILRTNRAHKNVDANAPKDQGVPPLNHQKVDDHTRYPGCLGFRTVSLVS